MSKISPPRPLTSSSPTRGAAPGAAPRSRPAASTPLAGLLSIAVAGCSFFAYGPPVVVVPSGTGDPSTVVGATVECSQRSLPIAVDVLGAGTSFVVSGGFLTAALLLGMLAGEKPDDDADAGAVALLLVPPGLFISSAIYGGVRRGQCHRALVASARAKQRGEPLRFEGAVYEKPAPATLPAQSPPGPPQSVAQPPQPPR